MAACGWWHQSALGRRAACRRVVRHGQALIEACLVLAVVCLSLFGLFELSLLYSAQEILDYAAARGARAETVGFNRFMVQKTEHIGAIPNAGRLVTPGYAGGPAAENIAEMSRLGLYLGGQSQGQLPAILDYENWDALRYVAPILFGQGVFQERIQQDYSLTNFPFYRAFCDAKEVPMEGSAWIESHYPLYMNEVP